MRATGISDAGEASQAVGDDSALRAQAGTGPRAMALRVKPGSWLNFARNG